jgi:hypothetical protein
MGTRRVPWRDWDEWEAVRTGLCGLDPTRRDAALHAVEGWRQRGRVPHAVDVTAQLMEARAHDAGVPGAPGAWVDVDVARSPVTVSLAVSLLPTPPPPTRLSHPLIFFSRGAQ